MKKRAFVCDPVCAIPYGHSVVGLKYFSDAMKLFFDDVVPIASKCLSWQIASDYGFEREFNFYYHNHIKIEGAQIVSTDVRRNGQDPMLELAIQDVGKIFAKYGILGGDSIVFPCVDYYGALGLLAALRNLRPENAPTAYFRFIGVMENATWYGGNGLESLVREITAALMAGNKIKLCAETPSYADHLAELLNITVSVVPYPVHAELVQSDVCARADEENETDGVFNVVCPGSARLDKGYLSLHEIFSNVRRRDPRQTIKFVTQTLPIGEAIHYSNYTNKLYAIPGVKLLPSIVSEDEMNSLYEQASLVLLPYDAATYAYRGSAVFMECISRGIPVIALAGPAFCKQIDYYGAGTIVSDIDELVDHVFRYRDMSHKSLSIKMAQARHRYSVDATSAFAHWIGQ